MIEKSYCESKPALHPLDTLLKQKTDAVFKAVQKNIVLKIEGDLFDPVSIEKTVEKLRKLFAEEHDENLWADAGSLTIVHRFVGDYDTIPVYEAAKKISTGLADLTAFQALSVRGEESQTLPYFALSFTFYDKPISHKYRHREF